MNHNLKDTNLPSDINVFKKAITICLRLLDDIDHKTFFSPYSVIPFISQALGLNPPLMGSGDSPYSITSIIFELKNKKNLLNDLFMLPHIEKRRIINEIYEMIAPYLLEEEDDYIDLLINTKYRYLLKSSKKKTVELQSILKEKFSILSTLINKSNNRNGDFGYIVHYGHPADLFREYDFLEGISESLSTEWRNRSYPIVNEIFIRNFPSIDTKTKKSIKGWVLFISNYTMELLENSRLRKRKILQAARLAEKLGAKIIGMGGLIASFASGGHGLSQEIKNVGFTTGHAYTIGNIIEIAENCTNKVGFDIRESTIGIVGAAGSIGSGCAKVLAEKGVRQLILIDLSTFSAYKKLEELRSTIQRINPQINIEMSTRLADIKKADIIICATNSPTSVITSEYLKKGAIVIDDSFPKNISKEIITKHKDIIFLEGGVVQLPLSIDLFFARNMPDLLDVPLTRVISCKETYGCFAEILVLALYGYKRDYGLGYSDTVLAKGILAKAKKLGFSSAPLQFFDEAVEEERFLRIKRIKYNQKYLPEKVLSKKDNNDKKANNKGILELIKARKTIRNYQDIPIPKRILNKIIEAGSWASSIHGFQPWKFIVIKKRAVIKNISDILMKKSLRENIGSRIFLSSSAKTIMNAQVLIIIFNSKTFSRFAASLSKRYIKSAKVAELSAISSSIQNMVLTAESLGISSCWLSITLFCEKEIKKICNIKEDELISVLSLGYPKEKGRRSKRKPISETLQYL